MTSEQLKEVMEYRGKLASYLKSGVILEAAEDWIRMELHNQKKEIQTEVAEDLRREWKRAQVAARARKREDKKVLRRYLKHLIYLILTHSDGNAKGRA